MKPVKRKAVTVRDAMNQLPKLGTFFKAIQ